jgi:hypothetical protein
VFAVLVVVAFAVSATKNKLATNNVNRFIMRCLNVYNSILPTIVPKNSCTLKVTDYKLFIFFPETNFYPD